MPNCENEEHKTIPIPALELMKAEDFYGTNTGKYLIRVVSFALLLMNPITSKSMKLYI